MLSLLPALYLLLIYRAALQGMGNTWVPLCSGIVELGVRLGGIFTLPALLGVRGVYLAETLGWPVAAAFVIVIYAVWMRRAAGILRIRNRKGCHGARGVKAALYGIACGPYTGGDVMSGPKGNNKHAASQAKRTTDDVLAKQDRKNFTQKSFDHRDDVVSATENTGKLPAAPTDALNQTPDALEGPREN